jgi:uncharacterized protein involved in exopolysaccharide biosynthesis
MDLRFYLSLFLRRLPYFLLFVALGSAVGITVARILPPVYVAEARLVVESEQIPDELAASTVQVQATEQLQIIQQRILTRDRLIEMANRLRIYAVAGEAARRMAPDEIVADLRSRISIVTTGGASARGRAQATLVTVGFEAPTAALAATVANEVVTMVLQEDVSMRTAVASQTLDFFEQEVARLDRELAEGGAAILAFKDANKDALPDSLDFRRSRQAAAQERLAQIDRDLAALRDRRAQLVQVYEATGRISAAPAVQLTPEEAQLKALRDERTRALALLSPENPKVQLLDAQIAALAQVVADQAAAAAPAAESPADPARTVYELQLADIETQIAFLEAQRGGTAAELETLRASIDATPGNAIALDRLERDLANTRVQYDQAVTNRARAETGDVIEAMAKGQRISVIEQAVAPRAPASPNRPLIAAAGVGGGFALGLGFIVLLELLNSAIRRPVELTTKLGITAFGTLPLMRTPGQRRRRRAVIGLAFAAVLVAIPAGLWAVDRYYRPLDLILDQMLDRLGMAALVPAGRTS